MTGERGRATMCPHSPLLNRVGSAVAQGAIVRNFVCRLPLLAIRCVVLGGIVMLGCGRAPAPEPTASPAGLSETPAAVAGVSEHSESPAATPQPSQTVADDPASAFNTLRSRVLVGQFPSLPPSFLADLNRVYKQRVRTVDPAARAELAQAIAQLADALYAKSGFILASDRVDFGGSSAEAIRANLPAVLHAIAAAARWPGWSETVAPPDFQKLLANVATALVSDANLANRLRRLRFETLNRDGATARVRVSDGDRQVVLTAVRTEGVWLPEAVVQGWTAVFASDAVALNPTADHAKQLREIAAVLRDATAAVQAVQSQAAFDAAADRVADRLLATAAAAVPRAVTPQELVTVELRGTLSDAQKDALLSALVAATDAPASGLADAADRPAGDGMNVTIGPVADVQQFADRLRMLTLASPAAGMETPQPAITITVEQVDAGRRAITAQTIVAANP